MDQIIEKHLLSEQEAKAILNCMGIMADYGHDCLALMREIVLRSPHASDIISQIDNETRALISIPPTKDLETTISEASDMLVQNFLGNGGF